MIPVDHNRLLNAADKMVSIDEAAERCEKCNEPGPGGMCADHDRQWREAFLELRAAIGRGKKS